MPAVMDDIFDDEEDDGDVDKEECSFCSGWGYIIDDEDEEEECYLCDGAGVLTWGR